MTFNADLSGQHYKWEEGAARISDKHVKTHALLKHYKIGTTPISAAIQYKEPGKSAESVTFEMVIPIVLAPLLTLPKDVLATSTIRKLLTTIHGPKQTDKLLERYPYRAEIDVMRADMALKLLEGEFATEEGYTVCTEGFSELISRMEREIVKRGGKILRHHELIRVRDTEAVFRVGRPSEGIGRSEIILKARRNIIFAIPSDSLKQIAPFSGSRLLRRITMKPLLRVYAIFDPASEWLQGLQRTVTPTTARYIIPNNPAVGSVQISYTDSTDAEPLIKLYEEKGEAALGAYIIDDLKTVFGKDIPQPLFVKAYPWKQGVSYWLPGDYDPYELSREACRPFAEKRWFLCGESYSTRQCWVEGALEHTDMMLKLIRS
jgi:hypothetical protein